MNAGAETLKFLYSTKYIHRDVLSRQLPQQIHTFCKDDFLYPKDTIHVQLAGNLEYVTWTIDSLEGKNE